MSGASSADKTEQATPQKLRKAREKGQVARSKDLATSALIIGCSLMLVSSADWFAQGVKAMSVYNLAITRAELNTPGMMLHHVGQTLVMMLQLLSPLFMLVLFLGLAAGALPGGVVFNLPQAGFKISRISPLKGLGKIFSSRSLVELGKSVLKVTLMLSIMWFFLQANLVKLLNTSMLPVDEAVSQGVDMISSSLLYLGLGLGIITMIDVPYQFWQHKKELKMSKQEVKDEHKQMEGRPEIKARIRQMQQQMSRSRAEVSVPNADVLLMNPTHYAVALKYDSSRAEAPFVIGKGIDDVALYMRQLAKQHGVEVVTAPPLARAVYHSTQIEQQIPPGLFMAVAHVLHYVMQIKQARAGQADMPSPLPNFSIPSHLRKD
ncbi:flagellar biosynthesis protein FlhB [Shewanella sp. NFH-SH190041]|uniref:flagellar biosynthesis protein FlhB n=1 Tax=Shewanella sp. NFH-SH190041 TaxID=2950245 RepID=UPI0021C45B80|nr:flagellar biosynthesis protein FlhB [Shewanella sp. NFH-SH190041]BDM62741.1 flagellar biosynthesis protein FlhB [Shewanella sp. NFH-SH190041]